MKNSGLSKDEFVYFLDNIHVPQNLIFNVGKDCIKYGIEDE